MARTRMFANAVIGSARFLRLSVGARLLYYDLGMRADDDGAVEAFAVMRICGVGEKALQELIDGGFLVLLNDDQVCYITHWHENNTIRKDRYRRGLYYDLIPGNEQDDPSATNGQPSDNHPSSVCQPSGSQPSSICHPTDNQLTTTRQPSDNQMTPQNRIDKHRKEKERQDNTEPVCRAQDFDRFWEAYPRKVGKEEARKAFERVEVPVDVLVDAISVQRKSAQWQKEGGRYIPFPANWLNQRRWEDQPPGAGQPPPLPGVRHI